MRTLPHRTVGRQGLGVSALDLGVDFLDTADMYGPFTNERLVGQAIRGRREGRRSPGADFLRRLS